MEKIKCTFINKPYIIVDFNEFKDIDSFAHHTFLKINNYILSLSMDTCEIWLISCIGASKNYGNLELIPLTNFSLERVLYEELSKLYIKLLNTNNEDWENSTLIKKDCVKPLFIYINISMIY